MRDSNTAFNAAESSLSDGESWVKKQVTVPTAVTSCGYAPCAVWVGNILSTPYQQTGSWWASNGTAVSTTLPGVAAQPRYIIELYSLVLYELSPDAYSKGQGYYYYRVSSRGTGATANSMVNVQSIFATQFN